MGTDSREKDGNENGLRHASIEVHDDVDSRDEDLRRDEDDD